MGLLSGLAIGLPCQPPPNFLKFKEDIESQCHPNFYTIVEDQFNEVGSSMELSKIKPSNTKSMNSRDFGSSAVKQSHVHDEEAHLRI